MTPELSFSDALAHYEAERASSGEWNDDSYEVTRVRPRFAHLETHDALEWNGLDDEDLAILTEWDEDDDGELEFDEDMDLPPALMAHRWPIDAHLPDFDIDEETIEHELGNVSDEDEDEYDI